METSSSLQRLKVADLRSKCKELKLANYSKLPKPQLIQHILEAQNLASSTSFTSVTSYITEEQDNHFRSRAEAFKPISQESTKHLKVTFDITQHDQAHCLLDPVPGDSSHLTASTNQKRLPSGGRLQQQAAKSVSLKVASNSVGLPSFPNAFTKTNSEPHSPGLAAMNKSMLLSPSMPNARHISAFTSSQSGSYTALVRKKKLQGTNPAHHVTPIIAASLSSSASMTIPCPLPITPAKRVTQMENHFLNTLFISLNRYRTDPILSPPFPSSIRRKTHRIDPTTHLAFQGIHPSLYTSANELAFHVSVRFWVFRIHTEMLQGCSEAWSVLGAASGLMTADLCRWPTVTECRRVSQDIWLVRTEANGLDSLYDHTSKVSITSSNGDMIQQTYLVLEATGEVVAESSSLQQDTHVIEGCAIRPDWFFYIQNTTSLGVGSSVFRYVKTKDDHEYPQGISKCWRQQVMKKGDSKSVLDVAERAVLTSCSLNR